MRTKLAILLFSALMATMIVAPSQAQIPGSGWWIYDGDSLYSKIPDVWIAGDSLHFQFAIIDSLVGGGGGGGSCDSSWVSAEADTLTLNDLLNVIGSSQFADDIVADSSFVADSVHARIITADSTIGSSADSSWVSAIADTLTINDLLYVDGSGRFTHNVIVDSTITVDSSYARIGRMLNFIVDNTVTMDSLQSRTGRFTDDLFVDSTLVAESLYVYGDVSLRGNLTVNDTTLCDYFKGYSWIEFYTPARFTYVKADTVDAKISIAPTFSATDFVNTEGYWDIIAGPDSLEWDITNNIYATTDHPLDFLIDEEDTMYCFFQESNNLADYRLIRGTGAGWSSAGTVGNSTGAANTEQVAMCQGSGDSLFVVYGDGTNLCVSVWNGSSFSAIDTLVSGVTYAGSNSDIARESDGTLHIIGSISAGTQIMGYFTGTMGSWSAVDTISTTALTTVGSAIVLDGSNPHVILNTPSGTTQNFTEFYSPAGGWDTNLIWSYYDTHAGCVGGAVMDGDGVIFVSLNAYNGATRVYGNSSGWVQLGGDILSTETSYDYPKIVLNLDDDPIIAEDNHPGIHVYMWNGVSWENISPTTGAANRTIGIDIDSNGSVHIVTRNGTNNYLLYGTKQIDPGMNTGHRNGALLIRTNVKNNAADIYIKTDSTIHIECDSLLMEGPLSISDFDLITASKITEVTNGLVNTFVWSGTITHDSVTAAATSEDIKLISNFPATWKILEIFVDVTEVWDDGGGAISACDLSIGWTGAGYADLMNSQDIYTTVTQLGDAAGEIAYVAVQGGIRPSWSTTTDIYMRFVATGANLSTLTTGVLIVYIVYQIN